MPALATTMAEPAPGAGEYDVGPLRADDVEGLGALHCRVWQVTYADLLTEEALAALTPERFARGWARRATQLAQDGALPDGEQVLVARHGGVPVGFISVGDPREADPPVELQLWALNALPEHQGTGLAQRLMAEGLGDRPAYLWVARGNERAIRFYRRHGFALDGTEQTDRGDGITELRMVRRG